MLTVISPAKTLDYETPPHIDQYTQPRFLSNSAELINVLDTLSVQGVAELMKLSDKLASLNVARYNSWPSDLTSENSKQAILAFKGDVYTGLDAATLSEAQLNYAQQHLRILSGLYGILRPLDLMYPYRLEMGTKLKTRSFKGLYQYWDDALTQKLKEDLKAIQSDVIINLASKEYFDALQPEELGANIINIHFRELRNGDLKFISYNAKRSRGWMVRYVVKNRLTEAQQLKSFDWEGYEFRSDLSDDTNWYFVREGN